MKEKFLVIFIFMLFLGTIINTSGNPDLITDNDNIIFEKKLNGQKYKVYLSGKCYSIGGNESTFIDGPLRINLHWIDYDFKYEILEKLLPWALYEKLRLNLIIVDGKIQLINASNVILENFTGWAPGMYCLPKCIFPLTRIRVFGVCDRIMILTNGPPPT